VNKDAVCCLLLLLLMVLIVGTFDDVVTGVSGLRVSYPHDSLLTIEYPFKMAVSFETIPHPLLSTERPLVIRRRVVLPDNVTHTAEWRYYGYNDVTRTPAAAAQNLAVHARPFESLRSRDGGSNSLRGYHGKELLVRI